MTTMDGHATDYGSEVEVEAAETGQTDEPAAVDLGGEPWEPDDDDSIVSDGLALFVRWERIQDRFVDEPRRAVEEADALVGEVVDDLARAFADRRERLEQQWNAGEEVSTEELRRALQRYRSFFRRLVTV